MPPCDQCADEESNLHARDDERPKIPTNGNSEGTKAVNLFKR
jgi:hypothetical protein